MSSFRFFYLGWYGLGSSAGVIQYRPSSKNTQFSWLILVFFQLKAFDSVLKFKTKSIKNQTFSGPSTNRRLSNSTSFSKPILAWRTLRSRAIKQSHKLFLQKVSSIAMTFYSSYFFCNFFTVQCSVVDLDPDRVGYASFCRIRILPIRIGINSNQIFFFLFMKICLKYLKYETFVFDEIRKTLYCKLE